MKKTKVITRNVGEVDERLPYKEFIKISRQQAEAMPLEITENDSVYEAFNVKLLTRGHMCVAMAYYKLKV